MAESEAADIEVERLRPTILRVRWHSALGMREFEAVVAAAEAVAAELGEGTRVGLLSVIEHELEVAPEVRRALVSFARRGLIRRSAVVAGPRRSRVLTEMIANAIRLVVKSSPETGFFDSEAEALAWLEEG